VKTLIFSGKGGVGKTTLAVNLANYLNKFGKSVVIGLDQQNNHVDLIKMEKFDVDYECLATVVNEKIEVVIENTFIGKYKEYAQVMMPDIVAMCNLGELMRRIGDKYQFLVIDFPPNHAGLTLLHLPIILNNIAFKAMTIKNRVRRMMKGSDPALENIEYFAENQRMMLKNFKEAYWFPLGIPTDLGLIETRKSYEFIKKIGYMPKKIIVNMVAPIPEGECEYCMARYYNANLVLADFNKLGEEAGLDVVQIPYYTDPSEIAENMEALMDNLDL